jgi:DNA-binding CsgD family transcriptional regulator/GAF domain-containing protein
MRSRDDLNMAVALDLVGRIYEAAAKPELWPDFLNAYAEASDCEGTVIWLHDTADSGALLHEPQASFVSNVRIASGSLASYADYFSYRNVLLEHLDRVPEGEVMVSSNVMSDTQLRKSEYYADWLRPQGIGYCLGGPVLKRGNTVAMISLSRPERHGPFPRAVVDLSRLLMPHLRRACLLHHRLFKLNAERSSGFAALEILPTAVWLLDAEGRLLFANSAGRELDQCRDGLWTDKHGMPVAFDSNENQELHQCISTAIAAGKGLTTAADGVVTVRRRRASTSLQVMVYPLGSDALSAGGAAAIFVLDPEKAVVPDEQVLRTLFGLTGAEASLVTALAQGVSLKDYCSQHRVTINTVRTQLQRAMSKTGTRRQSQLVSLATRLPARHRRSA